MRTRYVGSLACVFVLISTSAASRVVYTKEIATGPYFTITSFAEASTSIGFGRYRLEAATSGFRSKKELPDLQANKARKFDFALKTGASGYGTKGVHLTLGWTKQSNGLEKTYLYEARLNVVQANKTGASSKAPQPKAKPIFPR